jgi:pSer/pThr/pTyr-binding forkhead associated (FHA) protein
MGAQLDTTTGGFFVTIATPKGGTTTKKIEGDMLTVGRAEDCNLTIQHETLSRRHMSVQLKNGQCLVEDHASSNGTFVNGKRLKPHTPTRVLPEDFIQLGQSGVRLSVSVEAQMWKGAQPPPAPDVKAEEEKTNTIVTSTVTQRRASREAEEIKVLPRKPAESGEHSEKIIQEAQKRAAQMIQEAEVDAERRVEDIYRRAHATQAKMDEVYQKRLNEAYRSAEMVYQKSQAESETILDQARAKSAEIRAQAEGFVMELRRRTEDDCERILDEAQVTARELKESRLAEAEEMIRKKEEELLRNTREAMSTRLARFEEDLLKEAGRQRELLEGELNDRRLQMELDNKEQIELIQKLKTEASHLAEKRDREAALLREKIESETKRLNELQEKENLRLSDAKAASEKQESRLQLLKDEVEASKKSIAESKEALEALKSEISAHEKTQADAKKAADKVRISQEELDGQLLAIRSKFEETKGKLLRDEQKHLEEMKLETTRKVAVLEQQLVEELLEKKERLSREIGLMLETHVKEHPEMTNKNLRLFQEQLDRLMDTQIATLSKHPGAIEKQKSLVELKSREKWKATFMGICMGCVAAVGGQHIYRIVRAETSPIGRKVTAVQEARKADLEKRKFNPPQSKELRASYADSVIYTEDFVRKYQDDAFQKKLLAAAAPYMLKTWRIDEEKTIQLLASTSALVSVLKERRDAIHPDFIPQGIEKMKEAETEANLKMRQLLGSQVRVDSYKKFERKFYENNAQ